ncbi:MAG: DUF2852 domain-containing protein [Clostridiales bacterium]|nr:DUF2852 domain-containing protein [Clostridiales bacterium]
MNDFRNSNHKPLHIPWGLIIVSFMFVWPVGVGLLIYKIVTEESANKQRPNWE